MNCTHGNRTKLRAHIRPYLLDSFGIIRICISYPCSIFTGKWVILQSKADKSYLTCIVNIRSPVIIWRWQGRGCHQTNHWIGAAKDGVFSHKYRFTRRRHDMNIVLNVQLIICGLVVMCKNQNNTLSPWRILYGRTRVPYSSVFIWE